MVSLLAAQLRKRAQQSAPIVASGLQHKRPTEATILFETGRVAADKDKESIFHIGCNGLTELALIDPETFNPYFDSLFSEALVSYDRNLHTKEENLKLDRLIAAFLSDVAPFLLRSTGVTKCLEWLIRRFRIHLFNTEELIRLILPAHETLLWTKVSHVIDFTKTPKWAFVPGAVEKQQKKSLTRHQLVQELRRRTDLLEFVLSYLKEGDMAIPYVNAFVVNTLSTLLIELSSDDKTETLRLVISACFAALQADGQDRKVSAMMLVGVVCAKPFIFNSEHATELLRAVTSSIQPEEQNLAVISSAVLLSLVQKQVIAEPVVWGDTIAQRLKAAFPSPTEFLTFLAGEMDLFPLLLLLLQSAECFSEEKTIDVVAVVKATGVPAPVVSNLLGICYTILQQETVPPAQRKALQRVWCYLEMTHPALTLQLIQQQGYNVDAVLASDTDVAMEEDETTRLSSLFAQRLGIYHPHASIRARAAAQLIANGVEDMDELVGVVSLLKSDQSREVVDAILALPASVYWHTLKEEASVLSSEMLLSDAMWAHCSVESITEILFGVFIAMTSYGGSEETKKRIADVFRRQQMPFTADLKSMAQYVFAHPTLLQSQLAALPLESMLLFGEMQSAQLGATAFAALLKMAEQPITPYFAVADEQALAKWQSIVQTASPRLVTAICQNDALAEADMRALLLQAVTVLPQEVLAVAVTQWATGLTRAFVLSVDLFLSHPVEMSAMMSALTSRLSEIDAKVVAQRTLLLVAAAPTATVANYRAVLKACLKASTASKAAGDEVYAVLKKGKSMLKESSPSFPPAMLRKMLVGQCWRPADKPEKSVGWQLLTFAASVEAHHPDLAAGLIGALEPMTLPVVKQVSATVASISLPATPKALAALCKVLFSKEVVTKHVFLEPLLVLLQHVLHSPARWAWLDAVLSQSASYLFVSMNASQTAQVYQSMVAVVTDPFVGQVSRREETLKAVGDLVLSPNALLHLSTQWKPAYFNQILGNEAKSGEQSKKRARDTSSSASLSDAHAREKAVFSQILLWLPGMLRRMRGNEKVLPALCRVLDTLQNVQTKASAYDVEFYRQVLVQAICETIQYPLNPSAKLSYDAGRRVAMHAAEAVVINSIVQELRTTQNGQIQKQCLRILALVAQLQPKRMGELILPIFSFMGSTTVRKDDDASFALIERTLDCILAGFAALADQQVVLQRFSHICCLLLDHFAHIPEHRRLALFAKVASLLGGDAEQGRLYLAVIVCARSLRHAVAASKPLDTMLATLLFHAGSASSLRTLLRLFGLFVPYGGEETLLPHQKDVFSLFKAAFPPNVAFVLSATEQAHLLRFLCVLASETLMQHQAEGTLVESAWQGGCDTLRSHLQRMITENTFVNVMQPTEHFSLTSQVRKEMQRLIKLIMHVEPISSVVDYITSLTSRTGDWWVSDAKSADDVILLDIARQKVASATTAQLSAMTTAVVNVLHALDRVPGKEEKGTPLEKTLDLLHTLLRQSEALRHLSAQESVRHCSGASFVEHLRVFCENVLASMEAVLAAEEVSKNRFGAHARAFLGVWSRLLESQVAFLTPYFARFVHVLLQLHVAANGSVKVTPLLTQVSTLVNVNRLLTLMSSLPALSSPAAYELYHTEMVRVVIARMSRQEVNDHRKQLTELLLRDMQKTEAPLPIFENMMAVIASLNDVTFRSIFEMMVRTVAEAKEDKVVLSLLRFIVHLVQQMKGLVVGYVIQALPTLLAPSASSDVSQLHCDLVTLVLAFANEDQVKEELLRSLLTLLQSHMNQSAINVGPLVTALLGHARAYERRATAKDVLHIILHHLQVAPLRGLHYLDLVLDALADTANQYIAEIVPALSDILEGDDDAAEEAAKACLKKMETLTGEDMQAYL